MGSFNSARSKFFKCCRIWFMQVITPFGIKKMLSFYQFSATAAHLAYISIFASPQNCTLFYIFHQIWRRLQRLRTQKSNYKNSQSNNTTNYDFVRIKWCSLIFFNRYHPATIRTWSDGCIFSELNTQLDPVVTAGDWESASSMKLIRLNYLTRNHGVCFSRGPNPLIYISGVEEFHDTSTFRC